MEDSVPIFACDAPIERSGKGKLVSTICAPAIGEVAVMPEIKDRRSDEFRKRLTSIALRGDRVAVLDNVSHIIEGSELAAIISAARWQDRILGKSGLVDEPIRLVWILAGNNLRFSRENLLRSILIRLDANDPHPERREFKDEPRELPQYAEAPRRTRPCLLAFDSKLDRAWPSGR